jgi:hypothetical protein
LQSARGIVGVALMPFVGPPLAAAWWWLATRARGSVVIHLFYFIGLSEGYRVDDLGQVYPLARGTAPLMTATLSVLLVGEALGPLGWGGIFARDLRNAVNTFFYRDPDMLPTTAPATSLSSEPHSFSRVFTGAFFEGLAGMLAATASRDEAALLQVSKDIGAILVQGIRAASVVPTFMGQVAASMLAVAAARFAAQGYEAPLRSGFIRHRVLPPSMAVAATHASARIAALAASPSESKTLPTLQLSVAEYGLGVPSISGLCRCGAQAAAGCGRGARRRRGALAGRRSSGQVLLRGLTAARTA